MPLGLTVPRTVKCRLGSVKCEVCYPLQQVSMVLQNFHARSRSQSNLEIKIKKNGTEYNVELSIVFIRIHYIILLPYLFTIRFIARCSQDLMNPTEINLKELILPVMPIPTYAAF